MTKPSLPQGTRDFAPDIVRKRQYILSTIKSVFELYGFQPLETPAMENMETLMGKYGEEGDKLIFKILNNGLSDPKNLDKSKTAFEQILHGKNDKNLTERALRYDLTIPFARFVAMNHAQLAFPFKRYQIQPVWRADRPQRGRYREFYQCDADIVGSKSLLNEKELVFIYATAFSQLGIPVEIRINNRKILAGLAQVSGGMDQLTNITVAIDKLEKIGIDKVKIELAERGIQADAINSIEGYLSVDGSNEEKIEKLNTVLASSEEAGIGLKEISYLINNCSLSSSNTQLVFDPTLARGLNYYTGTIFEIKAIGVQMGSIGGGGRYDDLTGLFGVPNIPGVGISFGVDRIYDVMEELKLFPDTVSAGSQVLFFNLGEKEADKSFELLQQLRSNGVAGEMFHESTKFDKQFKYAEKKHIPFVVIIGEKELSSGKYPVKDLQKGEQQEMTEEELIQFFTAKK